MDRMVIVNEGGHVKDPKTGQVTDAVIEFHHSHTGSVTTAHSPEAAIKILAAIGHTPESYLAAVTPATVEAPSGFAARALPPPPVATRDEAQAQAERAASALGR